MFNQIIKSLLSRMELLRVTKTFSLSQYPCFDKIAKTSCMYEPSGHQNNLDLLLIDLGTRAQARYHTAAFYFQKSR